MKPYETTADFKARLAIAERRRRGEGEVSILGAAHSDPSVTRRRQPVVNDCTAAVEALDQTLAEMEAFTR